MTKQTKFILAIALQTIIIFAIIIFKMFVLTGGTDVLLKIVPFNSRDMLRGDYATFQYDISNLDFYYLNNQQIRNGDTVYVVLKQRGKFWTAQNVQKTKPLGERTFIKGKVSSSGVETKSEAFKNFGLNKYRIHIIYGIEDYFIPEGKRQEFNFLNKEVTARVAVDDNGNAVLKHIYVDDKPWP